MTRSPRFSIPRPWWPALFVLTSAGCEQVKKLDEDPQAGLPCEVQRVFTESCALAGCHDGTQKPDLTAGAAATSIESQADQAAFPYVDLGNPAGSYMASKLVATVPEGWIPRSMDIMPPATVPLPESDRALLVGWIAGAELEACAGSGGDDGTEPTDGGSSGSSTGAPVAISCSIADVVTAGEEAIDAGDAAGQIPTEIGTVLDQNCGCHYGTAVAMGYIVYPETSMLDMANLAGFMADVNGVPAVDKVLERLDHAAPTLHMPPIGFCSTEDGDPMPPADYDLLKAWLEAGVPDGATWMGM